MCGCVCGCRFARVHVRACLHGCVRVGMRVCVCAWVGVRECARVVFVRGLCACVLACVCTCTCECVNAHTRACTECIYKYWCIWVLCAVRVGM